MGERERKVQASSYGISHNKEKYRIGNTVHGNGIVIAWMVTDSVCGEHSLTYRFVQSLCCTPETDKTLYVNSTSIEKGKIIKITNACLLRQTSRFAYCNVRHLGEF